MGFIQRPLEKITTKLQAGPLPPTGWGPLYAAQQALCWALEAETVKPRYKLLSGGIPPRPKGCQAESDHSQS
jgi:hypothetical protein